ncbi:MAG: hypothetical protein U5J83_16470 [Bryobacterales bacterium]|nr:hypothetical protein [Bryobacterales bacterium]
MNSFGRFYRATAICSFLSVASTLLLIFLPRLYDSGESFESRLARVGNPIYMLRAWVYLLHPFVVLAAALGVAMAMRRLSGGAAAAGFLCFLLWALTEAGQQALTLVAYHGWAGAYATADVATQEVLRMQISIYHAIWDSMFLLLLIGFLLGNLLYGVAMVNSRGSAWILGVLFLAVAVLTAFGVSREIGGPGLPPALAVWLYPIVQPVSRLLVGLWLWNMAEDLS